MKKLCLPALVLGMVLCTSSQATPILELGFGTNVHKFELQSSNVFDGTFWVWTYKVTSADGNPTKSLSHWVIQICEDYFDHATDTGGTAIEEKFTNADPNLGITGLKFDDEYDDGEMRTVSLFFTKPLEVGTVYMGTKSGGNLLYGYIDGPNTDCNCLEEGVPEPMTIAMIGAGALGLTARRRKIA